MPNIIFQRAAVIVSLAAVANITGIASANSEPLTTQNLEGCNAQLMAKLDQVDNFITCDSDLQQPQAVKTETALTPPPIPGSADTTAATLLQATSTNPSTATTAKSDTSSVAQAELDPGRRTRSGSSYVGIGGNIGIGGDTAIGEFGFAVFSKIGLTQRFSVRPAIVISGDADILIPLTYDFPIQAEPFERINLAPYVGAGAIITTSNDSTVGLLLTGGVDLPLSEQFTATAGLNLGFNTDTVGVGLMLGVGYNFGSGFRF